MEINNTCVSFWYYVNRSFPVTSAAVISFMNSSLLSVRTGSICLKREHVGVRQRFLADQLRYRQGRKQAFNACLQPEVRGENIRFSPRHRGLPCHSELRRLEPGGSPDSAPVRHPSRSSLGGCVRESIHPGICSSGNPPPGIREI